MFFSEFHDCFGEIGPLKVKDNVKQVVTKLNKEFKRMVDLDIIALIKKLSHWVNSFDKLLMNLMSF